MTASGKQVTGRGRAAEATSALLGVPSWDLEWDRDGGVCEGLKSRPTLPLGGSGVVPTDSSEAMASTSERIPGRSSTGGTVANQPWLHRGN